MVGLGHIHVYVHVYVYVQCTCISMPHIQPHSVNFMNAAYMLLSGLLLLCGMGSDGIIIIIA